MDAQAGFSLSQLPRWRSWAFNRDASHESLAEERLRIVWQHASFGLIMATAFALVLAIYLDKQLSAPWIQVWLIIKIAMSLVRLVHRHLQVHHRATGLAWRLSSYGLLALDGAVWGTVGYLAMPGPIPVVSLVAAVLACISCVATFGLQVSLAATAAYTVPMLTPTALGMMLRGDDLGASGCGGLALLLVLQLVTSASAQHRLSESYWLRMNTQALAREKDEALRLALHQSAVKSQFLGNVSHELRTPLHGVLGLARLLHRDTSDPQARQRIELIEASGRHLLSLINDLLDLSRIEGGQFPLHEDHFELHSQLEHLAGLHQVRASDKGLLFETCIAVPQPCWVMGDPARLRQVLHNLLGNAIKFTQQGQVVLKVSTPAENRYLFEVMDTGPGIEPAHLPTIFQAFEQVNRSTSHPLEGVGLGLSIAKEIVTAMHSELCVDSQPGQGSCFHFLVSLMPGSAQDAGAAGRLPSPTISLHQALKPRILLAEDDDVNAIIATAYLEQIGAIVERAHDGKEAVQRALRDTHHRPDLILMDCRMPVMDGYAATQEIRTQELVMGLSIVPIIALTATVNERGRSQCIEAGMNDFLIKPFTPEQLAGVLRLWVGGRCKPMSADVQPRTLDDTHTDGGTC